MENYGRAPTILGNFNCTPNEMMFYQYLPIQTPERLFFEDLLEPRLQGFTDLIFTSLKDYYDLKQKLPKYVYLTAKHLFVTRHFSGNRPGYHTDGYGTDDINYIWYDKDPTVFCIQPYVLFDTSSHDIAMNTFELQSRKENETTYPINSLLRLDPFVVHKVPEVTEEGYRTFVKVSMSDHQYNLQGNSFNPLLPTDWKMYPRELVRNDPTKKESDWR